MASLRKMSSPFLNLYYFFKTIKSPMLSSISQWLLRHSTPRNVLLSGILFLVFIAGVLPWCQRYIEQAAGHAVEIIDLQLGKSPSNIATLLDSYGAEGRARYVQIETTVDVVYPIIYCLFYGLLLSWTLRNRRPGQIHLNSIVVAILIFDLLENVCSVVLARSFPNCSPTLMLLCTVLTHLKLATFILTSFAILILWLMPPKRPA